MGTAVVAEALVLACDISPVRLPRALQHQAIERTGESLFYRLFFHRLSASATYMYPLCEGLELDTHTLSPPRQHGNFVGTFVLFSIQTFFFFFCHLLRGVRFFRQNWFANRRATTDGHTEHEQRRQRQVDKVYTEHEPYRTNVNQSPPPPTSSTVSPEYHPVQFLFGLPESRTLIHVRPHTCHTARNTPAACKSRMEDIFFCLNPPRHSTGRSHFAGMHTTRRSSLQRCKITENVLQASRNSETDAPPYPALSRSRRRGGQTFHARRKTRVRVKKTWARPCLACTTAVGGALGHAGIRRAATVVAGHGPCCGLFVLLLQPIAVVTTCGLWAQDNVPP